MIACCCVSGQRLDYRADASRDTRLVHHTGGQKIVSYRRTYHVVYKRTQDGIQVRTKRTVPGIQEDEGQQA